MSPLRILRAAVLTAVACEAFYVVAMNVFLSTPLFDKFINATPDIVDIHYARGWSLFPTRIHARDLSIRATDSHVEWILRFDEIDFDCSLLELAKQRFTVSRARGSGITFRARMKVESPAATTENVEYLPPIDSLGPVGFIPSQPPSPALWNDAAWHLWTVRIDDAIAEHVREVWIEGGRFQGDARVTGRFLLKPMRAAYVGPAHVEVRSGSASLDTRVMAEPLAASIDFELARFDPRLAAAADLSPRISLSVDAKGEIPDLGNLRLGLPDSGELSGTLDVPRLAIRIVKGEIRDESHIDAHGDGIAVATAAHEVSGGVDLTMDVAERRLLMAATVHHVSADQALTIPSATLFADSAVPSLESQFEDLHGVLDIPGAELPQAAKLTRYLPHSHGSAARIAGGSLRGSLHAEGWLSEKRVRGSASVEAKGLDVRADAVRIEGDAKVDMSLGSLRLEAQRASDARVDIAVLDGLVATAASPDEPFLRVSGLRARAEAARVDVEHPLRSLRVSVTAPHAELFDRDSVRAALGLDSGIHLASRRARFDASASIVVDDDLVSGTVSARAPRLGFEAPHSGPGANGVAAVTRIHVAGDVEATAKIARWDVKTKTLGGNIELGVQNLTGAFDARASVPDFGASRIDVRASAASLDLEHPSMRGVDYGLRVDGATLTDARALNALLPSPKILAIESGRASASADISTSGPTRAAGGHIDLTLSDGGIRLHQTHLAGDFAVSLEAHGYDRDQAAVDLEGSRIAMRNVRVTGASTDTAAWAGDLVLQAGTLALSPTPKLEGDLTLEARDANPILGILFRDSLPKLVADMAQMPSFVVATHIAVDPEDLVISDLAASGGDIQLRGTYALRAGNLDAAFVVDKGPFSAGINLDNRGSHLRLFGLDGWYREKARQALAPR